MFALLRGTLSTIARGSKRFAVSFPIGFPTLAVLGGASGAAYGLHEVYAPLPYIAGGFGAMAFGFWLAGLPLGIPRRRGD